MTEFEVQVTSKGENESIRVFLSAELEEYSESLTLTLHSEQNPFFLYSAKITSANLSQVIRNNTSTELQVPSVKQIIFEQILPAVGPPMAASGDIATFDGKMLEFSSKRGIMKIPYFSIQFEAAAEKELAEHVYRLNQAEIGSLKEELEKKEEACEQYQLQLRDFVQERQTLEKKIEELSRTNTQEQMEIEEAKREESEEIAQLRLETENLQIRLNEFVEKSQKDEREIETLRSTKDSLEKEQCEPNSGAFANLQADNVALQKQIQQLGLEKMNLENEIHGLRDRLYEQEISPGRQAQNGPEEAAQLAANPFSWPREGTNTYDESSAVTPVRQVHAQLVENEQTGSQLSAQTQSILQKYSKNPMIQSILQSKTQAANPFTRRFSETPSSNVQDMRVSNLQNSATSQYEFRQSNTRVSAPVAPVRQSNLSGSTLALMEKYLKK